MLRYVKHYLVKVYFSIFTSILKQYLEYYSTIVSLLVYSNFLRIHFLNKCIGKCNGNVVKLANQMSQLIKNFRGYFQLSCYLLLRKRIIFLFLMFFAFLNVQKAFDRIWHTGLLQKIKKVLLARFLILLKSYLKGRSFDVWFNRKYFDIHHVNSIVAVPQSSGTADIPHETQIATRNLCVQAICLLKCSIKRKTIAHNERLKHLGLHLDRRLTIHRSNTKESGYKNQEAVQDFWILSFILEIR